MTRPTLLAAAGTIGLLLALPAGAQMAKTPDKTPEKSAEITKAVPPSRSDVQLSFAPVVKRAAPSVVNVYASHVEKRARTSAMEEFMRRFFGEDGRGRGMPGDRAQRSLGSGVILDETGLIITNNHVIENMNEVKVALADKREFEASIVLRDPRTDLAVVKIKSPTGGLTPMPFGDSDGLEVGDFVMAIGNPFGVGQTVTQGIVSALARTQVGQTDYQYFIQTDAAINPGNSGGALVDLQGRLVGVNTAIYSQSGGSHGIGFAIPASMVRAVVESAKSGASVVRRPWLGARVQGVTPDIAESVGLDHPTGVLVASLQPKSPAEEAGLKRGDVILTVDGQTVDDPEAFGYRFALKGTSGQTKFGLLRGSSRTTVAVKLGPAPETRPRDLLKVRTRSPFMGATLVNTSPAIAEEMQADFPADGVAVMSVEDNSFAARAGLQKGDMVLAVNGVPVTTTKDLERVTRNTLGAWEVSINRGGEVLTSVFGG
ncbi:MULTISPECIES: Do family serine endopeptidase [Methylobacterium]|uniref:Periplasmic serine endoprotease DegP n=2 Tax=Pseudomonadota TaxID=1224 RepID=A0ABQ4SZM6_9HYPH|nr:MULTISPECIES: Do family serine endopeptidase [Methylobacterium]PIU05636.1 MAG: serine protease [Methylobacterium sp. CG09_land_8_20_14_0_10_71_15]PIU16003.1 MAG: serine protease [Methylobacterium sp. CG08_land_8_20_14_0_20_71_15]GBU19318.1 serine endoprotease [Methylobacterium sp.]GJE07343.1 Periplasmic serine endoprotease DegP [Methylobacterium jeotgali]